MLSFTIKFTLSYIVWTFQTKETSAMFIFLCCVIFRSFCDKDILFYIIQLKIAITAGRSGPPWTSQNIKLKKKQLKE